MSSEVTLSRFNLEVIQNITEAVGKLKGVVELLSRDIQVLSSTITIHTQENSTGFKDLGKEVQETQELLGQLTAILENTDFAKIHDKQHEVEKTIIGEIRSVLLKLERLDSIEGFIKKISKKGETESEEKKAESKNRWGFWKYVIAALFGAMGTVVATIFK